MNEFDLNSLSKENISKKLRQKAISTNKNMPKRQKERALSGFKAMLREGKITREKYLLLIKTLEEKK